MSFNDHSELVGKHATISPSKYYVFRYDEDELIRYRRSSYAQQMGTALHKFAEERISYRLKLHKAERNSVYCHLFKAGIPADVIDMDTIFPNLMNYINDCIGFRLEPEVCLYYHPECYGWTDCITDKDVAMEEGLVRISDLKTGSGPAKMEQLMGYAALLCLEYKLKPNQLKWELRLYQNGEIQLFVPEPEDIWELMKTIVEDVKILERSKKL